jgi:hypothetical protein
MSNVEQGAYRKKINLLLDKSKIEAFDVIVLLNIL